MHREDGSSTELAGIPTGEAAADPRQPMVGGGGAESCDNSTSDSPAERACDPACGEVLVQAGTHSALRTLVLDVAYDVQVPNLRKRVVLMTRRAPACACVRVCCVCV